MPAPQRPHSPARPVPQSSVLADVLVVTAVTVLFFLFAATVELSEKVAAWTEAHYIDMMPHNPLGPICTAATVHFAAAVANFAWLETRAIGEYNERLSVHPELQTAIVPLRDGVSISVKKQ